MRSFVVLSLLTAITGCAAQPDTEPTAGTSSDLSSATWSPLLVCDGGAAVIDVDVNERRDFQLVVRDHDIVSYFESAFPGMTLANAKGEYIARSADWYPPGAFQKSDFHQFTEPGNAITGHPVTVVEREGNGVRVSLVEGKVGNLAPFCNGEPLPEENEGFGAGTLEYRVYHARADWLFRDCE